MHDTIFFEQPWLTIKKQQQKKKKEKKKELRCNCSSGSNEYDVPPVKEQEAENHVRRS